MAMSCHFKSPNHDLQKTGIIKGYYLRILHLFYYGENINASACLKVYLVPHLPLLRTFHIFSVTWRHLCLLTLTTLSLKRNLTCMFRRSLIVLLSVVYALIWATVKCNLCINLSNCQWFQPEVEFLGHLITKHAIKPIWRKIMRSFSLSTSSSSSVPSVSWVTSSTSSSMSPKSFGTWHNLSLGNHLLRVGVETS